MKLRLPLWLLPPQQMTVCKTRLPRRVVVHGRSYANADCAAQALGCSRSKIVKMIQMGEAHYA